MHQDLAELKRRHSEQLLEHFVSEAFQVIDLVEERRDAIPGRL